MPADQSYESISLVIPESLRAIMEERIILVEDIQQVIEYAERTGRRLLNQETGHYLAYYRPALVTYWVEYTPQENSYVIHSTYSHRMVIEEEVQK